MYAHACVRVSCMLNKNTPSVKKCKVGLSQLCLKICLKCFWEFPKNFPYYIMLTVITAVSNVYTHN